MNNSAIVTLSYFLVRGAEAPAISTLSLHDALPIFRSTGTGPGAAAPAPGAWDPQPEEAAWVWPRSEEHTSELQSRGHLVCRLLLEKKKATKEALKSGNVKPEKVSNETTKDEAPKKE